MATRNWKSSGATISHSTYGLCLCLAIAEMIGPEASELRKVLVRLSGRQLKYGVAFTRPRLFAGLSALMNALQLIQTYDVNELKQPLRNVIGEAFV